MKIGTDIVAINRIEKAILKYPDSFLKKFLNDSEIDIAKKTSTIAGFWATKEAVSKALGCGIGKELSFHDITIKKDCKGAPSFTLSSKAQAIHNINSSSISISHDGGFAIAIAAIQ